MWLISVLTVVGETGAIQVNPSLEVKGSPGLKPERTSLCERVRINGLQRFKHMDKYAHSLKLILNASTSSGKASNFDVCFHRLNSLSSIFLLLITILCMDSLNVSLICRNLSRAIGMCPPSRWEKVSKGSWVQTMSPFDHKVLDVRSISSAKVTLELSAVEGRSFSLPLVWQFFFLVSNLSAMLQSFPCIA